FIDDLLLDVIGRGEVERVVSLGAGLDTRPWRLDLPQAMHWVEVDFPDMLAYKREKLAGERPKCRLESLTADLDGEVQRRGLLDLQAGTRTLLLTEGLLTYLPGDTVRSIAVEAHDFRYWLLDVFSTWLKSRVPGRDWAPFERIRSESSLSGEAILE